MKKDYYRIIFCILYTIIGMYLLPVIWLSSMYVSYEIENYNRVKQNFIEFEQYDRNLLISFAGTERPHSLISYRFKSPYGDDEFFACYVNFFEKPTGINEEKIKQIYSKEIHIKELEKLYPDWEESKKCIGRAIYYPTTEVEERWLILDFTYIRKINPYYKYFDLLVKGNAENIELSTLTAEDAKVFVAQVPNEKIYHALVIYPDKNVVKMITACAGFTKFCGDR
jgi:hypothetical protein